MAARFTGGHWRRKIVVIAVFVFFLHGVYNYETKGVLLTEGDSVILNTGVELNEQGRIYWYFNATRIAAITVDLNKRVTDVQYENGGIFRDRLKLDNRTGSLTIADIRPEHAGDYNLRISSSSRSLRENVFNIAVNNVSAAERDKLKTVNEGDFFTLEPLGILPAVLINWYFNDTFITGNTGNEKGEERFGDRLKLDRQTGALTIKNSRSTDSGDYKLEIIISNRNNFTITILKVFSINVTGSSIVLITVLSIIAVLLLFVVPPGVLYCCHRSSRKENKKDTEVDPSKVIGDGEAPNTDDRRRSELDSLEIPLMNRSMTEPKQPALRERSISEKTKDLQQNQM